MLLRRLASRGILAITTIPLLVAGCTFDPPAPTRTDHPNVEHADRSPTPTFNPTPSGKWQDLSGKCPTIDKSLPGLPGIVGLGRSDTHLDNRNSLLAECSWEGSDGGKPFLISSVTIFRLGVSTTVDQLAADALDKARHDALERALRAPDQDTMPEDLTGLGDEAFLTFHPGDMSMRLKVLSANATISMTLWLKDRLEYDQKRRLELLRAQRSNIIAVTQDILDDLR